MYRTTLADVNEALAFYPTSAHTAAYHGPVTKMEWVMVRRRISGPLAIAAWLLARRRAA